MISGTEQLAGQPEEKFVYRFHRDEKGNWKIRIKYVDDIPVLYEERNMFTTKNKSSIKNMV